MRARGPDLLHPHLRKVLLEPALHLLAVMDILLQDVMVLTGFQVYPSTLPSKICPGMFIFCTRGGPAEVPGDELVQADGQDGSLSSC